MSTLNSAFLNSEKHKQARCKGYQARLNGSPITSNPYLFLSRKMQVYASCWDSGWLEADKNTGEIDQNIEQKDD